MPVTLYSAQVVGLDAKPIAVEVDVSSGMHIFSVVGLADKEVQESRQRIAAAIKNLGALAPHKKAQRVIVNLAPADIKKEGPAFDLPIALGYLAASEQIAFRPEGKLFLGELGLDGAVRPVSGILPIALAAKLAGFSILVLPKGNGAEAALVDGLTIIEVETLIQTLEYLDGKINISPLAKAEADSAPPPPLIDFSHIRGQEAAKRAMEIAAAGGHNVLLYGPPGTGKTILAQALSSILPPLSSGESLEVTKIYSIAGLLGNGRPLITEPPFRRPHHTASHAAVIGGGTYPRPGEITLAHRGVLFLDEFPEFDRRVIEALRQPLEERSVTVSRTYGTETFPAHFILAAAMNPCPCGNFGSQTADCGCSPGAVQKYNKKISGPMRDRIDLHAEVPALNYDKLDGDAEAEPSRDIRERVVGARAAQAKRFRGQTVSINAEMGLRELKKFIRITPDLRPVLRMAHERHNLSARAYHKVLKLGRTIADLAGSEEILPDHLSEALQYRPKQEI